MRQFAAVLAVLVQIADRSDMQMKIISQCCEHAY